MQGDPKEIDTQNSVERRWDDEDDEAIEVATQCSSLVSVDGDVKTGGVRFSNLVLVAELSPRKSDLDLEAQTELMSGTATVVDPAEHISRSQRTVPRNSLEVPKTREANLKDLARMIETSNRFSHVTPEQIERVRVMHDKFSENAKFSFNYNVLLLVASILAGLGLVSNSGTIVIASMLVSPIMGPVVSMAYGTTIRDWELVRRSCKTEGISIVFCIVMGTVISAVCGKTELANDWPTQEMITRGTWGNFLVGLPVAFFSGLGVAVSLLDEQTSSLVGVAISASLLPPAVNAGVVWVAYAFVRIDSLGTLVSAGSDSSLVKEDFKDEFVQAGMVSLFLTLANIILIYMAANIMFRMKEVLPIEKKIFWNDLGVARKIYQKRALMTELDAVGANPSWKSSEQNHEISAEQQQQRQQKRRQKHLAMSYKDASTLTADESREEAVLVGEVKTSEVSLAPWSMTHWFGASTAASLFGSPQ